MNVAREHEAPDGGEPELLASIDPADALLDPWVPLDGFELVKPPHPVDRDASRRRRGHRHLREPRDGANRTAA